jgi:putative aldouronate transport system substrate-binding protein
MKKLFLLIAVLLCLASWAFGAGRNQQSGAVPTITWWGIGSSPEPADTAEVFRAVSDYTQEKIGVRVEFRTLGDRMQTIISSGEAFDIIWTNGSYSAQYVPMGAYADITDLVRTQTPALWSFIPQSIWEGAKVNGKLYAVPAYKDSSCTIFTYIDERYVQKYNINATRMTLTEWDRAVRAMKAGEGSRFYPVNMAGGGYFQEFFILSHYDNLSAGLGAIMGVRVDDPSRKVVFIWDQPEVLEGARTFRRWYQEGIINPDAHQLADQPRGRPWIIGQGWPGKSEAYSAVEGGQKYIPIQSSDPYITTNTIQGSMLAIGANSRYKTETLKFIELMNTDHKLRDMLVYGIEGKHFEYVSPYVVKKLTDTYYGWEWAQGTFFTLSTTDDQPADSWEQVKRQNEAAVPSVANGFMMDISNLLNEIANCNAVFNRYKELYVGAVDPDVAIPQLKADLMAAGFDRIMAEAQRQIDAFFKQ